MSVFSPHMPTSVLPLYLQTATMSCFSLEETTLTLYHCMIYGTVGVILSHAYIMVLHRAGISQGNSHHVIDGA